MSELRVKTARGSLVMGTLLVAIRPVTMVLDIVLLRLLNPADFGLVALAMILFNTANLFTDMGMRQAIVQTQQDIRKAAWFAFLIVMTGSVAMTGLIILLAQPLANVLGGGADLVPIVRGMAVYITIDGLWEVPEGLLRRELKFKQLALAQIPAQVGGLLFSIALAYMGYGVWSLVIGTLLAKITQVFVMWAQSRPWIWLHPQRWDSEIVRGLIRYGVPTAGGSLVKFFASQVDTWYVGRLLGSVAVGLYSRAFNITTRLGETLGNALFGQVLFPSYAKLQNDKPRLKRAYLKSTNMVFLLMAPLGFGSAITAPLLVHALLGPKWTPMIPAWQFFSLYLLTRPISTNASPVFLALGQPRRNLTASVALLVALLPLLLLLTPRWGITGAALAVSLSHLVAMLFNVYQIESILPGTAAQTMKQWVPFLISAALMTLAIIPLQPRIVALTGGENLTALLLVILLGALVYTAATLVLQRALLLEIYELFIKALGIDRRWPRLLPRGARTIETDPVAQGE